MFKSARLKLTAWYLIIIMLISGAYSLGIYRVHSLELERFSHDQHMRIERRLREGRFTPEMQNRMRHQLFMGNELIDEARRRLAVELLFINGVILLVAGGIGYFLAGKTLRPIKNMVDEQHRFISDASHELRTPLTALKTSMEVHLRDKKLTLPEAKKLIEESIIDVDRLQALSDGLLQLATYEKANNHSVFESLSLLELVNEAVRKINPLAKQKHITIENKVKEGNINGNKCSLINLFVILLENAVKYSPEKSQIEIASQNINKQTSITVKDHGSGIDKKDVPHIFDRFYRADKSRTSQSTPGYGLGLSIAKKIMDEHNGIIEVKSKVGEGTTFQLFFSKHS